MLDDIGSLATCIIVNESRIACGPPPTTDTVPVGSSRPQASTSADAPPEAGPCHPEALPLVQTKGLPQVEDEVRASIADRLRHLTDYKSDHEDETPAAGKRKNPGVSGKLRTIDTTMVKSVRWLHEFVYTPTAQPVAYENISSMAFVDSYISVMNREPLQIKKLMLAHL